MNAPYRSIWTEMLATPFRQGWIDAGGIKTRFVQAGSESKPPLVMLHGTAGSLENFAANIAAHAMHFNCIAFDMIGSGMTEKPDYDYETEQYVGHTVDFFRCHGHQEGIRHRPVARRPRRLPVRDRPSRHGGQTYPVVRTTYFPARPVQSDIKSLAIGGGDESDLGKRPRDLQGPVSRPKPGLGRSYRDPALALQSARHETAQCHISWRYSIRTSTTATEFPMRTGKNCRTPTLIIAAVDHADVLLETARMVAKLIPRATVFEMKNCSHWPQMEDAETFNKRSLTFLLEDG